MKELSNIHIIAQAGLANISTPAPDNKLSGEGGWQVGYSDVCLNVSVCEKEKYEMQQWNTQKELLAALLNLPTFCRDRLSLMLEPVPPKGGTGVCPGSRKPAKDVLGWVRNHRIL